MVPVDRLHTAAQLLSWARARIVSRALCSRAMCVSPQSSGVLDARTLAHSVQSNTASALAYSPPKAVVVKLFIQTLCRSTYSAPKRRTKGDGHVLLPNPCVAFMPCAASDFCLVPIRMRLPLYGDWIWFLQTQRGLREPRRIEIH